jgi:pimeloyl-ACP methyl ester carboxylesterase
MIRHVGAVGIVLLITGFVLSDQSQQEPDYVGPVPKPRYGYGSDGPFHVDSVRIVNPEAPEWPIEVFVPQEHRGKRPVIFFAHGYGGNRSHVYHGLIRFLVSKGYAFVFVPYPTRGGTIEQRYDILQAGFRAAASQLSDRIDLQRVGFVGHSFGGGAVFPIAYEAFVKDGWGSAGRFIFSMAPWFVYGMEDDDLKKFPGNTKAILQVYADDDVNDHRMAIDLFRQINLPPSHKEYILVPSDTVDGYHYRADHSVPVTFAERDRPFDAYDYYAVYRLLDALCDDVFNMHPDAAQVALGNGHHLQTDMPRWKEQRMKPLMVTDSPEALRATNSFLFPCDHPRNPRRRHCP